jgi:hypothetical protein
MSGQTVSMRLVSDASQAIKDQEALIRKVEELSKSHDSAGKASVKAAKATEGSYSRLEQELKDNLAALKRLEIGSKEFDEQKKKVDQLAKSVKNAKAELTTSGGFAAKIGGAVKDFATSVAGISSLTGAVLATAKLLKSELEDLKRRDAESLTAVRTREQSIAALVTNAGGELTDAIVERVDAVQAVTGADADKLLAISSSVSSAGVVDPAQIVDIAQQALRSQGGDVGKGAALAGAAIDLSNTLKISVKEAFGVLFQTAGTARPEDIALLGKAAVRSTAALVGAGVEAEKAQELFAASTLLTGDKTGEQAISISNDLTQAFRKLQKEGVPQTVKIGGESVKVKLPDDVKALLEGDGLSKLTLADVLDLSRKSPEFEKVIESFLPDSQNRAFTQQIVGGSQVFDEKLTQAAGSIDLASSGIRTDQQIADVEGRRTIGVVGDLVEAALDKNRQDVSAALKGLAREAFTSVLARTDVAGNDFLSDSVSETLATGLELRDNQVAGARAAVLKDDLRRGKYEGKDAETVSAVAEILNRIEVLIKAADAGELSPRRSNSEIAQLTQVLSRLADNQGKAQPVRIENAGPVEAPPAAAGVP